MAKLIHLQTLRKQRGLRQAELAELAGVSLAVIRKHEQGLGDDVYLSVAYKLAQALDVSISALFLPEVSHREITTDTQAA